MMQTRREMLARMGTGLGITGLASMLNESSVAGPTSAANPLALKAPHFKPRIKHIIHLYMNGGPSQVDTFDPKPALKTHEGKRPDMIAGLKTENTTLGLKPSPFKFPKCGKSGLGFLSKRTHSE